MNRRSFFGSLLAVPAAIRSDEVIEVTKEVVKKDGGTYNNCQFYVRTDDYIIVNSVFYCAENSRTPTVNIRCTEEGPRFRKV